MSEEMSATEILLALLTGSIGNTDILNVSTVLQCGCGDCPPLTLGES